MKDLKLRLYPFALGFFVGGAVVAVSGVVTSDLRVEQALKRAEVDSRAAGARCDAAVRTAREMLILMKDERKAACD